MEERKAKIIFNKSGGSSGKNSITNRVTLPTTWIKEMGITLEDREVNLTYENDRIIIEKIKK